MSHGKDIECFNNQNINTIIGMLEHNFGNEADKGRIISRLFQSVDTQSEKMYNWIQILQQKIKKIGNWILAKI